MNKQFIKFLYIKFFDLLTFTFNNSNKLYVDNSLQKQLTKIAQ